MKTLLEVIELATSFLQEKGIEHPRREVLDLFSYSLGMRPLDLYMQFDRPLQEVELQRFREDLRRRALMEPVQYIRGEVDFFHCHLAVNRNVLIPRQETEILVDTIAKCWAKRDLAGMCLWDLCCGSGCIGIALKKRFPELDVILADISSAALEVAEANAAKNGVEVELRQGDFLVPFLGQRADFIVCNPPYVTEAEYLDLQPEVRDYEPRQALLGGSDGLLFYRQLASQLTACLRPQGQLWLELGRSQGKAVVSLFAQVPAQQRELLQDWSNCDRFFFLEIE